MKIPDWISSIKDTVPEWLEKVRVAEQPGRYYPCLSGRTKIGNNAALGFSCLALKIYYMLDLWRTLDIEYRRKWTDFILSFQKKDAHYKGAFVDPVIINNCDSLKNRLVRMIKRTGHRAVSHKKATLIAETKQAIATLAQVGIQSNVPFTDFPQSPDHLLKYLKNLNWTHPWGAGGQAAAIALFVANEAPKFLSESEAKALSMAMRRFFYKIVDKNTGGYFIGKPPEFGQLVNGAMKVLNAYEWLKVEIPYAERLIDTCLSSAPLPEGCHIVDNVYVLYRCAHQTQYRRKDIVNYCVNLLEMIKLHLNPDGAFSYYVNHNQTNYYGAKIAKPFWQSDIHGTYLFLFTLAMIVTIQEWNIRFLYTKT